jgi:biopolymer transport protein ExbD
MNLNKHDSETEMEMNMTPMIDVVFLLIIFFMIITDLTQQDLEDLELPVAVEATEDKPDPDEVRPVLNIMYDGEIIVKRQTVFDPEQPDDYQEVERYLTDQSRQMPKERDDKLGVDLPDNPLLIRADQVTEFAAIQEVMARCGKKGIQIWKVQLAAAQPEDEGK